MILSVLLFGGIVGLIAWLVGAQYGELTANRARQKEVGEWVERELGQAISKPKLPAERGLRLAEEAIELAQSLGTPVEMIAMMADRAYGKKPGLARHELAQVYITLLAAADACGYDLDAEYVAEWGRIDTSPPGYFADRMRRKVEDGYAIEKLTVGNKPSAPT